LRPRSELGGEVAAVEAGAGVEGALAAETGLRVGDAVLRDFAAGRRLRALTAAAGEDVDADAGVPVAGVDAAGGEPTLPALLLSASLSPARGALMRTRARAGVSMVVVAAARAAAAAAARCRRIFITFGV